MSERTSDNGRSLSGPGHPEPYLVGTANPLTKYLGDASDRVCISLKKFGGGFLTIKSYPGRVGYPDTYI